MSKKSKSGGKSAASSIPEPPPPVTPIPPGTDPACLPFPEWSDQQLNAEKWDLPKSKDKGKSPTPKKGASPTGPAEEPTQFIDPQFVHLPSSIKVHEWKRPKEIFLDANLLMFKQSSEYPDLISGSKHLLHSELIRSFISAIGILEYLGYTHPSPTEFASSTFCPNTGDEPWKPWFHIYSLCKAGKGQKHNPQPNNLGKYVVRLFWMGCWRKITIDDRLPIDQTNHVLLPTTEVPPPVPTEQPPAEIKPEVSPVTDVKSKDSKSDKKKGKSDKGSGKSKKGKSVAPPVREIELWPFILCKAIIKLASLTWTEANELVDFDIISCLTGWISKKIDTKGLNPFDIWQMCAGYTDHYTWLEDRPGTPGKKGGSKKGGSKKGDSKKGDSKKGGSKKSDKSSKKSGLKKVANFLDEEDSGIIPYHLVVVCSDLRTTPEEKLPDVAPCWSHPFLIDQTRDIPLIKPAELPEPARWKRFRWLAWAIRNGLWPPELEPIKCIRMVSSFKKCADHVIYKPPSKEAIDIKQSVAVVEDLALKGKKGKKGKKDKASDKSSKKSASDKKSSDKKSSKSSKSGKSSKKGKKAPKIVAPPDPSIWHDFIKLGSYVDTLYVLFKPSQFATNVKITDLAQAEIKKEGGKAKPEKGKKGKGSVAEGPKILRWTNEPLVSRNEPVYIFMDSLDYKILFVSLSRVGNTDVFDSTLSVPKIPSESDFICKYMKNQKKKIRCKCPQCIAAYMRALMTEEAAKEKKILPLPCAHVVVENFNWQSTKIGSMVSFLNTFGSKSVMLDIKEGRYVFRMWINSDTPYVVNLLSDVPIVVGSIEVVLEYMARESERLTDLCFTISSQYGRLVQRFGTPEYAEGLKSFYACYKPDTNTPKKQLLNVHEAFMQEFLQLVKDNFAGKDLLFLIFALKVLFLNPDFGRSGVLQDKESVPLEPCECREIEDETIKLEACICDSEELLLIKLREKSAVKIEALFKGIFVRKLKMLHSQQHKDYMKIFDALKKLYTIVFGVQRRLLNCPQLIRNFILLNTQMSQAKTKYSLYSDLQNVIYLQHFTGTISVPADSWVPITTRIFYCNSPNSILVKIYLFCDLPHYMVRVFNNDTSGEVTRFTNNANVNSYDNNALGYTVFCYGWSNTEKNLQWKLSLVSLKQKPNSLVLIPDVNIGVDAIKLNYIPNVYDRICRCLINVAQTAVGSFRLSISDDDVKICFRLLNENNQILSEVYGTGSVIIPAVVLHFLPVIEKRNEISDGSLLSLTGKFKSRSGSLPKSQGSLNMKKREKKSERTSSDKLSAKGSFSLKRTKTKSLVKDGNEIIKLRGTVYILEGFVVDNSWPLTKEEWAVVDDLKVKQLVGDLALLDEQTLLSVSKTKDISKKDSIRKSIDKQKQHFSLTTVVDKPFWCLQAVVDKNDNTVLSKDTKREEEIKEIKRKWYENNPGRYEKSKEIRMEYLESHYLQLDTELSNLKLSEIADSINLYQETVQQSIDDLLTEYRSRATSSVLSFKRPSLSQTFATSTKSSMVTVCLTASDQIWNIGERKTLQRPVSDTKILPPFTLNDYMEPNVKLKDPEDRWAKSLEEELRLQQFREELIYHFEEYRNEFHEDSEKFLSGQTEKYAKLREWYNGCREDSEELMQDAYSLRDDFIEMIRKEQAAKELLEKLSKGGKDKKDGKKGAKDKKSKKGKK